MLLSSLQNLSNNAQEVQNLYNGLRLDMTAKEIEGSITKTYLKKLVIILGEYEWDYSGSLIRNYGPTMLHILFKMINPYTSNGVSNLKYQIGKSTLAKFGNNTKDLLDDMSLNYSIIIEKVELYEYYF